MVQGLDEMRKISTLCNSYQLKIILMPEPGVSETFDAGTEKQESKNAAWKRVEKMIRKAKITTGDPVVIAYGSSTDVARGTYLRHQRGEGKSDYGRIVYAVSGANMHYYLFDSEITSIIKEAAS